MSNPQLHNLYHAYKHMYEALGVKNIDTLLPPPMQPSPLDPASENIMAMNGKKFQAFPKQDHQAHMKAHLQFMGTTIVRNNPKAMGLLQQNCMEHITLMAGEQIELEFAEEIAQMKQMGQQLQAIMQQAGPNQAQMAQNPQVLQMQQQLEAQQTAMEARKSQLIAEFMVEYAEAEQEVLNQIENDPLLKLKDREIDLRAKEEARKEEEGQKDLEMERAKLLQARELAENKMEQNDDHQKLRASVSLAKSGISQMQAVVKELSLIHI